MRPIFKMTAIATSLSIFALSGCSNKNDDNAKQKDLSFKAEILKNKILTQLSNNSEVVCPVAIIEGEQKCDVSFLAKNNLEILKLKISIDNKNKKAFNISEIKITEDSFLKEAIKESLENSNEEWKNFINDGIKDFETNILSNIVIGQDDTYKPTFSFSDENKVKAIIVSFLNNKVKPKFDNVDVEKIISKINDIGDINLDNIKNKLDGEVKVDFQKFLNEIESKQYQIYRNNNNLIMSYFDQAKNVKCTKTIPQSSSSPAGKVSFTINDSTSFIGTDGKPC